MDHLQESQTKIDQLLARRSVELEATALVVIHHSGQILAQAQRGDAELATIAALAAGMVSAAQSMMEVQGVRSKRPFQLSHDDGESGCYVSQIAEHYWLFASFEKVLNPGLFRMRVRQLALDLKKLVESPGKWIEKKALSDWESAEESSDFGVADVAVPPQFTLETNLETRTEEKKVAHSPKPIKTGDKLALDAHSAPKLFQNISDAEIDQLFDR